MAPQAYPKRPRHSAANPRHNLQWAGGTRTTVYDAQRYTRFVGLMKRVLLAIAGALILAVLAYALQPRDTSRYAMNFEHLGRVANDLTMAKPRLMGTDSDGSPFVVTADKAVQDAKNLHHAHLFNVQADLTAKDGAWYDMSSPRGYLDTQAQKLWLTGPLAMYSDSGYELHTSAAFVDLAPSCDPKTGKPLTNKPTKAGSPQQRCAGTTIRGDHEVTGLGPLGTLRADRFHVVKATRRVFLDGHVRMVLYPAHGAKKQKKAQRKS